VEQARRGRGGQNSGEGGGREMSSAQRQTPPERQSVPGRRFSGVVFLQLLNVLLQFLFAGQAREVELEHFQGPLGRLLARPQADQQAGDYAHVQRNRDAVAAGRQQMAATQNALEPAKKEFHGPAEAISQSYQFRVQVQAVSGQQQDFGPALTVGFAGIDLDDAQRLFEHGPAFGTAQVDDAVALDSVGAGGDADGTLLDHGPHGVVAYAADEAALGVDNVLEELVFGVAAVHDIQAIRLKRGPQFLDLRAVGAGHRGVGGYALEDVELQVHLQGAFVAAP